MSRPFFYGLSLTILLASTNLLSMYTNRINRNLAYPKRTEKKSSLFKELLFSAPSPIPNFKKQSITLHSNDMNLYSLIFNRSEQPCITHYLLNGQKIAQLIQINGEINFESDCGKPYHFSLQNPYQADSLTINTQGRFIFEKKINTESAFLTAKRVDFADGFFSKNGLMLQTRSCKTHAELACVDFLFTGKKLAIMPKSSLILHNSLTVIAQLALLNSGQIESKKDSLIKSPFFENLGTLTSHTMRFEGNKAINPGILTITDTFSCASELFEHSGMLDAYNFIMEKGDLFSSTPSSVLNINRDWKAFITSVYLQGSFNIKNLHFDGKSFTTASPFHCIAETVCLKTQEDVTNEDVIKVFGLLDIDSKNIKLAPTSDITAENADFKVSKAIENGGNLSVKNNLSAHARSISNKGKIETDTADIKADRYLYNGIFSQLSANNGITIHTPLALNLLGLTHAQSLTINSGIGLNAFGIYAAKNLSTTSLFSANAGLLLPKFSSFAEMYSWQNIRGLGESLLIKHVPVLGTIYSTFKNIQGLYHQGRSICSEIGSVYSKGKLRTANIIALVCLTKNLISSGRQTSDLCQQSYSFLSNSTLIGSFPTIDVSLAETKTREIAQQLPSTLMSLYAPSVNTDTILGVNYGGMMGCTNNSNSLLDDNYGASLYMQNTINTFEGRNSGYLGGYNVDINASFAYTSSAPIHAINNVKLHAGTYATINANIEAKNIKIESDYQVAIKANANLKSSSTHLGAEYVYQDGVLVAQNISMKGNDVKNRGTLRAPQVIITQSGPDQRWFGCLRPDLRFSNSGTIDAPNLLFIDAKNIELEEKSHISTQKGYFKSNGYCKNGGNIQSQELVIDSKTDVINNGSINSPEALQIKAGNLSFGEKSNVKTKDAHYTVRNNASLGGITDIERGTINAGGKVTTIGKLGASDRLEITAPDIINEKTADVSAHIADLKATNAIANGGKLVTNILSAHADCIDNSGDINAKAANLKATTTITNSGKFEANELTAHAKYVVNSGKMILNKEAHIKADRCFLNLCGSIEGESNLKIDTLLLLNALGYIGAESVCTNSIVDLNLLGMYQGYNISQNSFIALNKGIVIPKFKSFHYVEELATRDNFKKLCGVIGAKCLPQLSMLYSLYKCCTSDNEMAASLCGKVGELFQKVDYLSKKKNLCLSEIVPVLCEGKNLLACAIQTTQQTFSFIPNLDETKNQFSSVKNQATEFATDCWNNKIDGKKICINAISSCVKTIAPILLSGVASVPSAIVSTFGPQLSRNSLVDINSGLMLGINGSSQSLYNLNSGVSLFAHNNSISTISGSNTGLMAGGNVSVSACQSYSSSGSSIGCNVSMAANDLDISGSVTAANNIALKAHRNAKIDGKVKASDITVQGKNILIKKNASIASQNKTNITAEQKIVSKGTVDGKETTLQGNEVVLADGSKTLAHGESSTAVVRAEKSLDAQAGAQVHAQGGTTTMHSKEQAKIDCSVTGNETSVQAKTLDIEENAHISSTTKTNIIGEKKLSNKGSIDGKITVLQGNDIILENGSKVLAHDGPVVINADTLQLKDNSHINSNTASINARSIQGEAGNTITTVNGGFVKTDHVDNSGTINGHMRLDYTGEESQLKRIGNVKDLTYSGTLDNGIADRLADGHNPLVNVQAGGSVAIDAGKQNVHLKEEHDMAHTLQVQTEGSIKCDKDLSSEKSTILQAKGDIDHASVKSKDLTYLKGKNISSSGHVTREKQGENYTEYCEKNRVSGGKLIVDAQENINYKGTDIHSGAEGADLHFGKKFRSDALEIEKHTKSENFEMGSIRKNTVKSITHTEDTITTSVPNTISSDGITRIHGNVAELQGTIFDSNNTIIDAGIKQTPTYNTHVQEEKTIKDGKVVSHLHSTSRRELPIRFKETTDPQITSDKPVSLYLECDARSITIDAPEVELRLPKETSLKTLAEDKIYIKAWDRATRKKWNDTVHGSSYNGTLNTNAKSIRVEDSENSAPTIINPTSAHPNITRSLVKDIHEYDEKVIRNRPTPLLINTAALAVSVATQGLGASLGIGFKAALAGVSAFGLNAAHTFLQCHGNYKEAGKQIIKPQALRAAATAALISAFTLGADQGLNKYIPSISQAKNIAERFLFTAPREFVRNSIKCAGDVALGKNPKKAAKDNARLAAAGVLGTVLSGQIGQLYGEKKIDPITHKLLHAGVGAMEGAIVNGKSGAIAGAIGAGAAETIADIARPKAPCLESILQVESQLGRPLTKNEFAREWNKQTIQYLNKARSVGDASKMVGATAALIANQDVDIAYNTAAKAIDHNFFVLVDYGIFLKDIAYALYQTPQIYEKEGTEEALKHLGIDVIKASGKLALGRATQVITFKVGNKIYPSASLAINAFLDKNPGMKHMLGSFTKTLTDAAEKLANTGLGKQAVNLFQYVNNTESKIQNAENKIVDNVIHYAENVAGKVAKQLNPSLAKELVEQVVPRKTLQSVEKQLAKEAAEKSSKQLTLPAPKKNPLLAAPLKTNTQNTKPVNPRTEATRKLSKKPIEKIPKHATKGTDPSDNSQAEKNLGRSTSNQKNTQKHVDQSCVVDKREKSLASNPAQGEVKSSAQQPTLEEIKPAIISPDSVLHQDVAISMKEIAEQEITKAKHSLSVLEKNVERFRNTVSHEKVGEIVNLNIDYTKFEKIEIETKRFYNLMRTTNEDISAIVNNTGINKEILNQIKNHVFIEDHILDNGVMRFDPCPDMAAAWKRLISGNFVYSDLVLLQHEYAESFAMQKAKIPYRIAHEIVNKMYNWEILYK